MVRISGGFTLSCMLVHKHSHDVLLNGLGGALEFSTNINDQVILHCRKINESLALLDCYLFEQSIFFTGTVSPSVRLKDFDIC